VWWTNDAFLVDVIPPSEWVEKSGIGGNHGTLAESAMPTIPLRDEPKPVVEPKLGETAPPAT
jgi:hypothetical protein